MSVKTSHRRAAQFNVLSGFIELGMVEWAVTDEMGEVHVISTLGHRAPDSVSVKGSVRKVVKARAVTE